MHGQMLSPTDKKWFYVGFSICIYIECMIERKKYDELTLKFHATLLNLKEENRRDFV